MHIISRLDEPDARFGKLIAKELDDNHACSCGKCSNCVGHKIFPTELTKEEILMAQNFIRDDFNVIKPRKQWPAAECTESGKIKIPVEYLLEEGRVLSNYGDAGWGREVLYDKYKASCFRDELVMAAYNLLKEFVIENEIKVLTYIPSLRRPNLVKDFAERLAKKLGVEFFTAIEKTMDVMENVN